MSSKNAYYILEVPTDHPGGIFKHYFTNLDVACLAADSHTGLQPRLWEVTTQVVDGTPRLYWQRIMYELFI
jgi:hypothetical protein